MPDDDGIVTIRDIYSLVQQVNTRVVELTQQVNTLTERAQEDRLANESLAEEMGKLKIKVYAAMIAITLASTMLVAFGSFSGTPNP